VPSRYKAVVKARDSRSESLESCGARDGFILGFRRFGGHCQGLYRRHAHLSRDAARM
jgi:hypothetical protein